MLCKRCLEKQALTFGEVLVMLCAQPNSRRLARFIQEWDEVAGARRLVLEVEEKIMTEWTGKAYALHCFYCLLHGLALPLKVRNVFSNVFRLKY